jgi:hypothetical protein
VQRPAIVHAAMIVTRADVRMSRTAYFPGADPPTPPSA